MRHSLLTRFSIAAVVAIIMPGVSADDDLPLLTVPPEQPARPSNDRVPVVVRISEEVFRSLVDEKISEVSPVRKFILGTHVTGNSDTEGDISVDLHEATENAKFEMKFEGRTRSKTFGRHPEFNIQTTSTTEFWCAKMVHYDAERGFYSDPATVVAQTSSRTDCLSPRRRLPIIRQIARRKATRGVEANRAYTDRLEREETKQKVQSRFDNDVDEHLAGLNRQLDFRSVVEVFLGSEEVDFHVCSSQSHLYLCFGPSLKPHLPVLPAEDQNASPVQVWIDRDFAVKTLGDRLKLPENRVAALNKALDAGLLSAINLLFRKDSKWMPVERLSLQDNWLVVAIDEDPLLRSVAK